MIFPHLVSIEESAPAPTVSTSGDTSLVWTVVARGVPFFFQPLSGSRRQMNLGINSPSNHRGFAPVEYRSQISPEGNKQKRVVHEGQRYLVTFVAPWSGHLEVDLAITS